MSRDKRTLLVLAIAVLTAGLASFGVYRAIQRIPVREIEVAHSFVVAASRELPTGTRLGAADVKLVPWPNSAPVTGAFTKVDDVVNRGVVMSVQENEPVTETKLAPIEAGAGITPVIPDGMRAISVRVNEVIGVAGFVTPGTRVDVFATLQQQPTSQTKIIVSNVQVLAAGTRYEQDKNKPGEAIPSSVVTLLVTPQDAERVVLASTEGQVMLALRNPLDVAPIETPGTRMSTLFGSLEPAIEPAPEPVPIPVVTPKKPSRVVVPPPPPVPEARPYTVEAIRGAKRTAEIVHLEGTLQ
jgi:pilus assembly protein CpaB